jgi:hypothetical protein
MDQRSLDKMVKIIEQRPDLIILTRTLVHFYRCRITRIDAEKDLNRRIEQLIQFVVRIPSSGPI